MLTKAQKESILNYNSDNPALQVYIRKVFEEAPNVDNQTHIEGLAMAWLRASELEGWQHISFRDVVARFRSEYEWQQKVAKKFGQPMPPLELDLSKPDPNYIVNEELTAAAIQAQIQAKNLSELANDMDDGKGFFDPDDDKERFYGTVVNETVVKKLERANELLEIIELTALDVTLDKFEEANPHANAATVGFEADGLNMLKGSALSAFQELCNLCSSVTIIPYLKEAVRIAFTFENLWKEHRLMNDAEAEEYWNSHDED